MSESTEAQIVAKGIAHDVRNAMVAMSTTVETLELITVPASPIERHVHALRRQVNQMIELMGDLDDFVAPPGDPTSYEAIPLGTVVSEAWSNVQGPANTRQVSLEEHLGTAALIPLSVDRAGIILAFQHLFGSAVQRSPRGGTVLLAAMVTDDAIELTITDRGVVLTDDDIGQRLEPFFPRPRGGFGLRLTIAKRIVAEHGGSLTAAGSTAAGTLFVVRIPRSLPAPTRIDSPPQAIAAANLARTATPTS